MMAISAREIESRAFNIVQRCGFRPGKPIDLHEVAVLLGAHVAERPLDADVSGVLVVQGRDRYVLVNESHHTNRKRFTIAHEFGHLVLHDMSIDRVIVDTDVRVYQRVGEASSGVYDQADSTTTPQEEKEANFFAAALLMPSDWVQSCAKDLQDDDSLVESLADMFQVSVQACFIRLQQLNIIESYFDYGKPRRHHDLAY